MDRVVCSIMAPNENVSVRLIESLIVFVSRCVCVWRVCVCVCDRCVAVGVIGEKKKEKKIEEPVV